MNDLIAFVTSVQRVPCIEPDLLVMRYMPNGLGLISMAVEAHAPPVPPPDELDAEPPAIPPFELVSVHDPEFAPPCPLAAPAPEANESPTDGDEHAPTRAPQVIIASTTVLQAKPSFWCDTIENVTGAC